MGKIILQKLNEKISSPTDCPVQQVSQVHIHIHFRFGIDLEKHLESDKLLNAFQVRPAYDVTQLVHNELVVAHVVMVMHGRVVYDKKG